MTGPAIAAIAPFFIVRRLEAAVGFYRDRLGFEVASLAPPDDPFFAIVKRDAAIIFLKEVDAEPHPNPTRDDAARWDAFVSVTDPDGLAAELAARGVAFREPLGNNDDTLRGFEVADADGYVLYFGRPVGEET